MRIAYITAGAAGMFCGSCLHDNTLVAALTAMGHDAVLVPTYTPIRTDEVDVSLQRVFLGGINVFLQQKFGLFRHTPRFFDRLLDSPRLLRWVSRFAVKTQAEQLGDLTISVLKGAQGYQRKEVAKLARWLAGEIRPEIVNLTSALLSGLVPAIKEHVKTPILCTLQGDDIFLEALPEGYRRQCLALIREQCQRIDGFISTSVYYADFMAGYFGIPREKIDVVYPGLNLQGHGAVPNDNGRPFTVGYFARICPEKGLHVLTEAYARFRQKHPDEACRLRVSGWLGESNRSYFENARKRLDEAGLTGEFEHVDCPDHASKVQFLQCLDVLSVPTTYREPKGLYVLEAWANGVPVVQPSHGSFPELIAATGGGLLVKPEDADDLAQALGILLKDNPRRTALGQAGKEAIHSRFHAARMAAETEAVYQRYL
jgi:glycosyltransferase involved in cell wall biosynthesis